MRPDRKQAVFCMLLIVIVSCGARAAPSVALVPLDNRPPCLDHAQRLALIAGLDLVTPPYSAIGAYTFDGKPERIERWLDTLDPAPDYLIVSLDMLAYGGLVASRTPGVPQDLALARLKALDRFAAAHPRTKIFAFGIIQRIARTATGDPGYDNTTELLAKYLKLRDQAEVQKNAVLRAQADALVARIPEKPLEDLLAARARNHAVNQASVALAASGTVDYLVLAMDDNAEYGPHRTERDALNRAIADAGIGDRALIKPGADEAAQLLLARAANHARGLRPRIALHFSPPQAAHWIPPLEDRPLADMAAASLAVAGTIAVPGGERAHGHLVVFAGDAVQGAPADAARQAAALAACLARGGAAAGVADVRLVNRADQALAGFLLEEPGPAALSSYAGWNTAGNAFGTAAAHLLMAGILRLDAERGADIRERAAAHAAFLLQRFADDYLYMAAIRPPLETELRMRGASPFDIPGNLYPEIRARLAKDVETRTRTLFAQYFESASLNLGPDAPAFVLSGFSMHTLVPWFRLFEIDPAVSVTLFSAPGPDTGLPPRVRVFAP